MQSGLIAAAALAAMAGGAGDPPGADVASAAGETGNSTIFLPFNKGVTIPVTVDAALVTAPSEHEAELWDMHGFVVTMVDTYKSNPLAAPHCIDGKERYVRLLNIASKEEAFHLLVSSCVKGVTAADPVVTWEDDKSGFTVHLTSAPPVKVRVDAGGTATVVE